MRQPGQIGEQNTTMLFSYMLLLDVYWRWTNSSSSSGDKFFDNASYGQYVNSESVRMEENSQWGIFQRKFLSSKVVCVAASRQTLLCASAAPVFVVQNERSQSIECLGIQWRIAVEKLSLSFDNYQNLSTFAGWDRNRAILYLSFPRNWKIPIKMGSGKVENQSILLHFDCTSNVTQKHRSQERHWQNLSQIR